MRWVLLLSLLLATAASADSDREAVADELIVKWRDLSGQDLRISLESRNAGPLARISVARRIDARTQVMQVTPETVESTLAALRARQDVEYVERNFIRRSFGSAKTAKTVTTPNDPHYPAQWHIPRTRIDKAWQMTTGSAETVVAVIDSGIRADHPDLAALGDRLLAGYDFVSKLDNAGDRDGRDANPHDPSDSFGLHGTHVAGIIAAMTNNEKGVAGINWHCKLLPVRVMGVNNKGNDADISAGIRWAAGLRVSGVPLNEHPADVINLSLGDIGSSKTLDHAIDAALAKGVIVVAASGNYDARNPEQDANRVYPGAFSAVITVAATDFYNTVAGYANVGSVVDLMAPGGSSERVPLSHDGSSDSSGGILSTLQPGDDYYEYYAMEGTSQAAPIVAGVVSLMHAIDPKLRQKTAADALIATSNLDVQCKDCRGGLLDAEAALLDTVKRVEWERAHPHHELVGGCSTHPTTNSLLPLLVVIGLLYRRRN